MTNIVRQLNNPEASISKSIKELVNTNLDLYNNNKKNVMSFLERDLLEGVTIENRFPKKALEQVKGVNFTLEGGKAKFYFDDYSGHVEVNNGLLIKRGDLPSGAYSKVNEFVRINNIDLFKLSKYATRLSKLTKSQLLDNIVLNRDVIVDNAKLEAEKKALAEALESKGKPSKNALAKIDKGFQDFVDNYTIKLTDGIIEEVWDGMKKGNVNFKGVVSVESKKELINTTEYNFRQFAGYKNTIEGKSLSAGWYRWVSVGDARVRTDHAKINNKVFNYDEPPYFKNEKASYNAGEKNNCRCIAKPIFYIEKRGARYYDDKGYLMPKEAEADLLKAGLLKE